MVDLPTVMEEEEEEVKEEEDTSWEEVFSRLDKGDGDEDGRIACRDFIDWIDMLSFQDSISLEVSGLEDIPLSQPFSTSIGAKGFVSGRAPVDGNCS